MKDIHDILRLVNESVGDELYLEFIDLLILTEQCSAYVNINPLTHETSFFPLVSMSDLKRKYCDVIFTDSLDPLNDYFLNFGSANYILCPSKIHFNDFTLEAETIWGFLYKSTVEWFDVFMPIGPNDYQIAQESVMNKRKFLPGLRHVFYTSDSNLGIDAVYVDNSFYPFEISEVVGALGHQYAERAGWYFQQLKQLYFPTLNIRSKCKVLSICCDVFFLRRTMMFEGDIPVYTLGYPDIHPPYRRHCEMLLDKKFNSKSRSFISHHCVFERKVLRDLFSHVEEVHAVPFWKAFIDCTDVEERSGAAASEYEIYMYFITTIRHRALIREANFVDFGALSSCWLFAAQFVACHYYLRDKKYGILSVAYHATFSYWRFLVQRRFGARVLYEERKL